ncbi:hypothetical protein DPMN_002719 [Dreissena polymorpha]|uniref:Uncharacterized protein n=1 Tax=Dreissena polymorpha TaxID=45954 RepID=A0A9D4RS11_DREPO|nr:hypothetical protein DPMN_002719 [Dreissena polymorpha]
MPPQLLKPRKYAAASRISPRSFASVRPGMPRQASIRDMTPSRFGANRQTDRQTNQQTGQKQYVPHYYSFPQLCKFPYRGHTNRSAKLGFQDPVRIIQYI